MKYLSPSALNLLMEDPRKFEKRYITYDEDKELPSDQILLGSLIHSFLASEEPLHDKNSKGRFLITDFELPSEKIQDILWVYWYNTYRKAKDNERHLFELTFENDSSPGSTKLLSLCKAFGFIQHLKTDKGRLEHFTKNNGDKYFKHLKAHGDKVSLITSEDHTLAKTISDNIKKNRRACEIINFDQSAFEVEYKCEYNEYFGLKGITDNHWYKPGHLYINDFKTTEKDLRQWHKDLRWDTKIPNQMAQYDHLILKNNDFDLEDVIVHRHIIYINQKNGDVYPFEIKDETFAHWKNNWKSDLKKAEWHFATNEYLLPHDFANYLVTV